MPIDALRTTFSCAGCPAGVKIGTPARIYPWLVKKVSEYDQKSHNHTLQANQWPQGVCVCMCVGTLIFSYIRRLRPFLGLKILIFNIFGFSEKLIFFGGYEDFVDISLGP